jgi:hypothetical protein
MVFKATFNNISVISWLSILLVEETGVPVENYRPVASHWQTGVPEENHQPAASHWQTGVPEENHQPAASHWQTGVPEENHQPVESHWQTLSHNVVSFTTFKLIHKIPFKKEVHYLAQRLHKYFKFKNTDWYQLFQKCTTFPRVA